MVGDCVIGHAINVGFKDGPRFVFGSDIPLGGNHCLSDTNM
jgi:hypothetical protein